MLYTYNIYEKMMKEVSNNKENTTFTIPGQKNIYYIGCSICPKNFYKGVFILGPCSTIKSNDANIPFKPLKIKQYLIHILRIIWKEYKNEIGMTFTEFLNKIRIEKSKELLLEDKYSILDIALMVGFNNQNYYNIMFKKITNQTPLEFKRNAHI